MTWPVHVLRSAEEAARAAAGFVAASIAQDVDAQRRCAVAFSGGRTPLPMFGELAALDVPWPSVDVFQVDERAAPDGHPDRNLTALRRRLGGVGVRPMPVTSRDLCAAADEYARELIAVCGDPPVLDIVHLGIGPDGHTASLFPGAPELDVTDRAVVATTDEHAGYRRMTLTFPVLDRARRVFFLETGSAKSDVLARVLRGDDLPAARIAAADVRVFADADAASGLS